MLGRNLYQRSLYGCLQHRLFRLHHMLSGNLCQCSLYWCLQHHLLRLHRMLCWNLCQTSLYWCLQHRLFRLHSMFSGNRCQTSLYASDMVCASAVTNTTSSPTQTAINKNTTTKAVTSTPSPTPGAMYETSAKVEIAKTRNTVCVNLSFYVSDFCNAIEQSNPGSRFTCQASALDGIVCPLGVCPCNTTAKRLLLTAGTSLTVTVYHSVQQVQPPAMKRWMDSVVIERTCPINGCSSNAEFPIVIVVVALVAVLLLCCCACLCVGKSSHGSFPFFLSFSSQYTPTIFENDCAAPKINIQIVHKHHI